MVNKTLHRKLKNKQDGTEQGEWTHVLWKGYNPVKSGDKSWFGKVLHCDDDKRQISVVICDTDIP